MKGCNHQPATTWGKASPSAYAFADPLTGVGGLRLFLVPVLVSIPGNHRMASGTLPAGVVRTDPAGNQPFPCLPCLVAGVVQYFASEPVASLFVSLTAIAALNRLEVAQMLKHDDAGSLLAGKLHNAVTDLMGYVLIQMPYLLPKVLVILLPLSDEAGLASVNGYLAQQPLPKAV